MITTISIGNASFYYDQEKTGNPKMFRNEISYSDEETKLVGYEKI